jgi:hypothetical protein
MSWSHMDKGASRFWSLLPRLMLVPLFSVQPPAFWRHLGSEVQSFAKSAAPQSKLPVLCQCRENMAFNSSEFSLQVRWVTVHYRCLTLPAVQAFERAAEGRKPPVPLPCWLRLRLSYVCWKANSPTSAFLQNCTAIVSWLLLLILWFGLWG